ncbi:MAG: hypothetical protein LBP83_09375 [Dysgonamonadaceae bacterium]|jgi:hypothetical protein|nr:hypothetical protein [Dysgonamonadaceae bacterium]
MASAIKNTRLFLYTLILSITAGCDTIHEFPGGNPVDPTEIDIEISIKIDMAINSDTVFQTYATMLEGDYDIRYIVDIYETDESQPQSIGKRMKRIIKTENSIISEGIYNLDDTITLPVKKYQIITWMDFVSKGSRSDKYYNTEDLQKISILPQEGQYTGYNTTKDAFTAKIDMDLTPFRHQRFVHYETLVEVKRPFAIYQIITTDIDEYITYHQTLSYSSIQPSTTLFLYNLFFPTGYNAYLQAPDNFKTGIHYTYDIVDLIPEKEAILASDYVFVEDDTFYTVDFEIFSAENKHINTITGLKINLERNKMTILRSEFLTRDLNEGSVGINDSFSDEIIIPIN